MNLVLVSLGPGLNGVGDHRQQLLGRFIDNRLGGVTECITGNGLLQLGDRYNITGKGLLDRFLLLAFQFVNLSDPLLNPLGGVKDGRVGVQRTRIDSENSDLACVGIGSRLENQSRKRLLFIGPPLNQLITLGVGTHCIGAIKG